MVEILKLEVVARKQCGAQAVGKNPNPNRDERSFCHAGAPYKQSQEHVFAVELLEEAAVRSTDHPESPLRSFKTS